MKYDLRLCLGKNLLQFLQITDISCDRMHLRFHIQKLKKIRLRRRLQCISGDFCPKLQKKTAEPGTLKACMPGHENLFSFIKTKIKCITHLFLLLVKHTACYWDSGIDNFIILAFAGKVTKQKKIL